MQDNIVNKAHKFFLFIKFLSTFCFKENKKYIKARAPKENRN